MRIVLLCKVVKQFKFIAMLFMLYMMCDVLQVASHLSWIFDYPDIYLPVLQTLESIKAVSPINTAILMPWAVANDSNWSVNGTRASFTVGSFG